MIDDVRNVRMAMENIVNITDSQWKSNLGNRKRKKLEFHDRDRDERLLKDSSAIDTYEKFYGNKKYYNAPYRLLDQAFDFEPVFGAAIVKHAYSGAI